MKNKNDSVMLEIDDENLRFEIDRKGNVMRKRGFWNGLLATSAAIAMICGCVNTEARLSAAVLNAIAAPIPGIVFPFNVRPPFMNAPGAGGALAAPVLANFAAIFAGILAALPAPDPVLAGVGAGQCIRAFSHMVNVRHLWRWPNAAVAGHPNANDYYFAWCRAARIGTPIGTGAGVFHHSSFLVPIGGNAWNTYTNVVAAINNAIGAGNFRIAPSNGPAVNGGGPNLPPAGLVAPAPVAGVAYVYVNIGAAAGITGIKYDLNAGGRPAVAGRAFVLPAAEAAATIPELNAAVAGGGGAPAAAAFAAGGPMAPAIAPQPINTVIIRIDAPAGGGAPHVSIYAI